MQPIVNFLEAEDHYYWRYLTFGFGDQFAYLSLLTNKTATMDGSYHTARTIPELRQSGIGQIDTAYWALKGIPAIGPILRASGQYGVRVLAKQLDDASVCYLVVNECHDPLRYALAKVTAPNGTVYRDPADDRSFEVKDGKLTLGIAGHGIQILRPRAPQ